MQADRWIAGARLEPCLNAADRDLEAAVALYEWHTAMSAACFATIQHFEVLLRNAIDGQLGDGQPQEPLRDTWLMDSACSSRTGSSR